MSDIVGQIRQCAQDLGRDDEETKIFFWHCGILREAANEIVSLRQQVEEARAKALEEAAREAESSPVYFEGRDIAAGIRALSASTLTMGTDPKPHTEPSNR